MSTNSELIAGQLMGALESQRVWGDILINVKNFGAKGNNDADDTTPILKAVAYAIANLPCTLYFPPGTYRYTDLGNLAYEGLTLEGAGERQTILKCINSEVNHNAILMNAFRDDTPMDQFVKQCNVRKLQVQGNTNTDSIFNLQGIVHSHWEDVTANTANDTTGKAYNFRGVIASVFVRVSTSSQLGDNDPAPNKGLYMTNGVRGGSNSGSATNNVFINCYFETVSGIGIHLNLADQTTFIGGSSEANGDKGLYIEQALCRWNTFMGVAFETNTTYDVHDLGRSSQFINIYSASPASRFEGQQAKVSGGYFSSIQVFGTSNSFDNLRVNMHGYDEGGFADSGIATNWKNLYDMNAAVNGAIYPFRPRGPITVGSSPFTWQNTTGHFVEVIAQTGTLSQVLISRTGQGSWLSPITIPNKWILAPNDSIQITYSVAPGLSYNVWNGV